jgi:anti-sigma B factor antagonist
MSETQEFRVAVSHVTGDQTVVAVSGDLDLLGATRLHLPLMDALSSAVVVLDLSECGFVDSSGLRTILEAAKRADSTAVSFRIAGVGTPVVRVLETAGLLGELSLYPDAETALKR